MSNILPLTIEGLVSLLLLTTILYCVRLNSQLKRLKADEAAFKATIAEIITATETAERAITGLKMTMREAEQGLGERLRSAERFSSDIAQQIEAGQDVLARVTQIAGARSPQAPTVAPKPAIPDAKAIGLAAQALAERARSRVKGLAA